MPLVIIFTSVFLDRVVDKKIEIISRASEDGIPRFVFDGVTSLLKKTTLMRALFLDKHTKTERNTLKVIITGVSYGSIL